MPQLHKLSKQSLETLGKYSSYLRNIDDLSIPEKIFSLDLDVNSRQKYTYRNNGITAFSEAGFWSTDSVTALEAAIDLADDALIQDLVSIGADINAGLNYAVQRYHKDQVIKLLIFLGGDASLPAVKNYYEKIDMNRCGSISQLDKISSLKLGGYYSVYNFFSNLYWDIKFEITDPIDGVPRSGYLFTPLHYAAYHNDEDLIKDVLKARVNINRKDKEYNQTPLELAATYSCDKAVKILLENGATQGREDALNIVKNAKSSIFRFFSCRNKTADKIIENALEDSLAANPNSETDLTLQKKFK